MYETDIPPVLTAPGQDIIPFHRKNSPLGEVYRYEFEKCVRFILRTFALDELAQTDFVELCITLNGAELYESLCHLTAEIKIIDARAVDPRDGTPISCVEDGVGCLFSTQSRNYCFALKSLVRKDSKPAY